MFCYPEDSEGCYHIKHKAGQIRRGLVGMGQDRMGGRRWRVWHATLKERKILIQQDNMYDSTGYVSQVSAWLVHSRTFAKSFHLCYFGCVVVLLSGTTPVLSFNAVFVIFLIVRQSLRWILRLVCPNRWPAGTFSRLHRGSLELRHSDTGTLYHLWLGWLSPDHSYCSGGQLWLFQTSLTYILYIYTYILTLLECSYTLLYQWELSSHKNFNGPTPSWFHDPLFKKYERWLTFTQQINS